MIGPGDDEIVLSDEEVDVRLVRRVREVVRIRKRIVTEESTFTVTTRREELVVERRPATASDRVEERRPGRGVRRLVKAFRPAGAAAAPAG